MTPDPRAVLGDFASRMVQSLAPDLRSAYLQGSAGLMTAAMSMMVEEWDRAADRLAQENAANRALFTRAAPLAPSGLATRLAEDGAASDADLKISTLQAGNDRLRALLIELQAWAEDQTGPALTDLNTAIWAELVRSTERRRFAATPF